MADIDYKKLYQLQDRVLEVVFNTEKTFYLTGGTCLSRFYFEKRYSDDLDFFTNDDPLYGFAIKNIKDELEKVFDVAVEVESKSFYRFKINKILQLDFVNDIAYRYKKANKTKEGYLIDNLDNILSNKITAIISRDNPKDIFDLYLISKYHTFDVKEILEVAHKKTGFESSDFLVRLKTFPKQMIDDIKLIDKEFLNNFDKEFDELIERFEKEI